MLEVLYPITNWIKKSNLAWYLLAGGLIATASVLITTHAQTNNKCYGALGQEITCPESMVNFELNSRVRVGKTGEWQESIKDLVPEQELEFEIKIKNSSLFKVNDVKVVNILPNTLNQLEGDSYWTLNDLDPGAERLFVVRAKTTKTDLNEGQEVCLPNVASLVYNGKVAVSDKLEVCLVNSKGQVQGARVNQLPETGIEDIKWVIFYLGIFILGLGLYRFSVRKSQ